MSSTRVLNYDEREKLKKSGEPELARYHRFIEDFCPEDRGGVRFIPDDFPLSFEQYCEWLREFPGWSYDPLIPRRTIWRDEYYDRELPMNEFIKSQGLWRREWSY